MAIGATQAMERIAILVEANAQGALKEFGKVEKASRSLGEKVTLMGDKMRHVGAKMSRAITLPFAVGAAFAIKKASDLAEAVNVTGLVFEDSRGEIDKFVKTAARGLGQSERAAREATAQFGGLLKNLGFASEETVDWSKKLTVLASDLGSAFNAEPEEAVLALGSALRGETEPIRRFNVMLDDAAVRQEAVALGLAETTAEVDRNGKAQGALSLIMKQTVDVQGDFANTADGLANRQRILKARFEDTAASVGTKLLPIGLKLAEWAQGLLDAFSNLDPMVQNLAIAFAAVAAALGPVMSIAGNSIKAVQGLAKAVVFLATSSAAASVAAVGLAGALAGALVVFTTFTILFAAAKKATEEYNEANASTVNNLALLGSGVRQSTKDIKEQAVAAFVNAKAMTKSDDATEALAYENETLARQVPKAVATLEEMNRVSGVSKERIVQLANELGVNLADMTEEGRRSLTEAVTAISRGVTPTERLERVTETLSNEYATTAEEVDAFNEALDALLGSYLTAEEATIRVREKTDDLAEAIREGKREDETAAQFKDRLTLETIDLTRSIQHEIDALVRDNRISADVSAQKAEMIRRLEELKRKFPELAPIIDQHIYRVASIPSHKGTEVTADTSQASRAIDILRAKLEGLNRVEINRFGALSDIQGRHAGGPVSARTPYVVGEKGPELFVPGVSGTIVPNHEMGSGGVAAGGSLAPVYQITNHIHMPPGSDGEDVVRALRRYERRNGPLPVKVR